MNIKSLRNFRLGFALHYIPLVGALLIFTALCRPLLSGQIFVYNDLLQYQFPIRTFFAQCLKNGDPFFWMPSLLNGYFVHGEGQGGFLHPFHLGLYRFLPTNLAFQIEVVSSYAVIFIGALLWLRRRLDILPATFGAFSFTFSSFCSLRLVHSTPLQVVAHFPWLLLAIDAVIEGTTPAEVNNGGLCLSFLTGSMLLMGFPQCVVIGGVLQITYVFTFWGPSSFFAKWRPLIFFQVLGITLGAAQWLPSIDYYLASERIGKGLELARIGSLNPLELFQWLGPFLLEKRTLFTPHYVSNTHELGLYEGVFSLFAVIWVFLEYRRTRKLSPLVRLGLGLCLVGLFFSLGCFNGVFYLYAQIPPFSLFRYHSRFRVLLSLGLGILSAVAIADFSKQPKDRVVSKRYLFFLPAVGSSLILILSFLIRQWRPDLAVHFSTHWINRVIPVVFLCFGLLIYISPLSSKWLLSVVLLVTVMDRGCYLLQFAFHQPPEKVSWVTSGLMNENRAAHIGNLPLLAGARLADGYVGVAPKRYLNYWTRSAQRVAAVNSKKVSPRYWLVTQANVSKNPAMDLPLIDPDKIALVANPVLMEKGEIGTVSRILESPGKFAFEVNLTSAQLLVVSESYHEGWQGRVDGNRVPVLRVNGDFFGALVPSGSQNVSFEFFPRSLLWGLWVSVVSLVVWCGILIRYQLVRRLNKTQSGLL